MARFHLFSLRVERPTQTDILDPLNDEAPTVIRAALETIPELVTSRDHHWHVGQLEVLGAEGLYFQLGRVTSTTEDQWDYEARAFVETQREDARWTPVVLHLPLQVAGIAPNSIIGRKPSSLGRKLRDLLNNTGQARARGFRFDVNEINDPGGFIQRVIDAWAVEKFSFTVAKPNFADKSEMSRALEQFVQDLGGREGKAEVKGADLDNSLVAQQTREAIARGGKASARIKRTRRAKARTIHVGEVPVTVDGEYDSDAERRSTLDRVVERFDEVRTSDEQEEQDRQRG